MNPQYNSGAAAKSSSSSSSSVQRRGSGPNARLGGGDSVKRTPSIDDMLEVSPVNTMTDDDASPRVSFDHDDQDVSDSTETRGDPPVAVHGNTISSSNSSSSSSSNNNSIQSGKMMMGRQHAKSRKTTPPLPPSSASSVSSSTSSVASSAHMQNQMSARNSGMSEFDKALSRGVGKPSTGYAKSFLPKQNQSQNHIQGQTHTHTAKLHMKGQAQSQPHTLAVAAKSAKGTPAHQQRSKYPHRQHGVPVSPHGKRNTPTSHRAAVAMGKLNKPATNRTGLGGASANVGMGMSQETQPAPPSASSRASANVNVNANANVNMNVKTNDVGGTDRRMKSGSTNIHESSIAANIDSASTRSMATDSNMNSSSNNNNNNASMSRSRSAPTMSQAPPPPPPPPPPLPPSQQPQQRRQQSQQEQHSTYATNSQAQSLAQSQSHSNSQVYPQAHSQSTMDPEELASGVLPDVLMSMRQTIESLTLFDSDMMRLADTSEDPIQRETRESLKRSSQQSISAAVLVSLAHKRHERRRLAANEIRDMVRSLIEQDKLERVRAILLLLSDDYVRSTSPEARKGGLVALSISAKSFKKARHSDAIVQECKDLILAAMVHGCQDHEQRVRYYATESLFNVIACMPTLAEQHFFILFEILRSLFADVDIEVQGAAALVDKKLKEVIVGAMNSGSFTADTCVPVFARFVYMRNKATKRLTLTWLQELNEKLIGTPILQFLHLFLGGIFDMIADPTLVIRQSALAFLQSVLPKLCVVTREEAIDDMESSGGTTVDFDKILQSLVTTMEHPDPFVRKVAMYWIFRIVKVYMTPPKSASGIEAGQTTNGNTGSNKNKSGSNSNGEIEESRAGNAMMSVRNSLPHVLPGVLLSIGDMFHNKATTKDFFLPDQTTHNLASQTNACLQEAVRREGHAYVHHLDGFIVALREELDSPSGLNARNPPGSQRKMYRMDANHDGSGIERKGFFPTAKDDANHDRTGIASGAKSNGYSVINRKGSADSQSTSTITPRNARLARNARNAANGEDGGDEIGNDATSLQMRIVRQGETQMGGDVDEESMMASRLCALHWVIVLYESVVPDVLKADYAREFIVPIIHQMVENPPNRIIEKSLQVLARITVPEPNEAQYAPESNSASRGGPSPFPDPSLDPRGHEHGQPHDSLSPLAGPNTAFALDVMGPSRSRLKSRDRAVFAAIIRLHSSNPHLLCDLSRVLTCMCRLQPPEFVFVSFAIELEQYIRDYCKVTDVVDSSHDGAGARAGAGIGSDDGDQRAVSRTRHGGTRSNGHSHEDDENDTTGMPMTKMTVGSRQLQFVSSFVQQMCHILLNSNEAQGLRNILKDCVGRRNENDRDRRRVRLFHILLHSFAHNLVSTVLLCLWAGAYKTSSLVLRHIDPSDINLMFLLEMDKLVEMIERPVFRHLHVRMLESDRQPTSEGSGTMLFLTLKSLLMILPQSACFHILKDRLVSASRFRQSVLCTPRIMIGGGALGKAAGMGENTSATAGEGKHEDDAKDGTAINTNHGEDEEKRSNGGNRGNGGNDGMSQAERETHAFVSRVQEVRMMHYEATWQTIRAGSLEVQLQEAKTDPPNDVDGGDGGNGRFDDIDNALELDLDDDGDHNDVDDDDDSNLGGINIDLDDAINVDVDLDDGLDATAQSAIPTGRINDPVGVVQPAVDDKSWKQFWTDSNAA